MRNLQMLWQQQMQTTQSPAPPQPPYSSPSILGGLGQYATSTKDPGAIWGAPNAMSAVGVNEQQEEKNPSMLEAMRQYRESMIRIK